MTVFRCPGSDTIRNAIPEELHCPGCGREVEIWADEVEATCPACGGKVSRRPPVSCWEWCSAARECLGPERYDRLTKGSTKND